MRPRTLLFLAVFAAFSAVVQAQTEESIPLRNWAVNFPMVAEPETVRFMPRTASLNESQSFVPIAPCRIVDTRRPAGSYGGPAFATDETRSYIIPSGPCAGIPIASAYSLNFTITNFTGGGFLTTYPTGTTRPFVSTLNFGTGSAIANAAIVPADAAGSIDVYTAGPTNVVIDINGYFGSPATQAYARIQGDGTLLPSTGGPDPNLNIAQVNIEHPATGVYCIGGLPFSPRSGMVSADGTGLSVTTNNRIVSLVVFRGNSLNGCGAGFQQARIFVTAVSDTAAPAAVDGGFILSLAK